MEVTEEVAVAQTTEAVVAKPTEAIEVVAESTEAMGQDPVENTLLESLANVALVPRTSSVRVEADAVVQVQSDVPGTANPTLEEQEREKQEQEEQEQQEEPMDLTPQGKEEERAGVGQPPLEEVRESPAIEQVQPQPLGLTPSEEVEDEVLQSPIGTGVCKEKTQKGGQDHQVTQEQETMVDAQSDGDEGGLLPSTAGSMRSQVFTQMSEEASQQATPIENPTAYMMRGGSTTQSPSSGEEYNPSKAASANKAKKRKKGQGKSQKGQQAPKGVKGAKGASL